MAPLGRDRLPRVGRKAPPFLAGERTPSQLGRPAARELAEGRGDVGAVRWGMEADRLKRAARRTRLPDWMTPAYRDQLLRARWRLKYGLEARALVALARAPDALAIAQERITANDFLTP